MEKQKEKSSTVLTLNDRSLLSLNGISDIISSDEASVYLNTSDGALLIEGSELHIISMNVGSGEITLEGRIDALSYRDCAKDTKSGFFARMFK